MEERLLKNSTLLTRASQRLRKNWSLQQNTFLIYVDITDLTTRQNFFGAFGHRCAAKFFPENNLYQKWKTSGVKIFLGCTIFDFWITSQQIFHNFYYREVEKVLNRLFNVQWKKKPKFVIGALKGFFQHHIFPRESENRFPVPTFSPNIGDRVGDFRVSRSHLDTLVTPS